MAEVFRSLVDMQEKSCKKFASLPLFGTKKDGAYQWMTFGQFASEVDALRSALKGLGVERGKKVAVIADNRVEWAAGAYACYGLGAHYVPMYEAQLAKDWEYILKDSETYLLFVSKTEIYEKVKDFPSKISSLKHVVCFEAPESNEMSYKALLKKGAQNPVPSLHPELSEVAGLIYTSGTTGKPKGVILSHGNFTSNINAVQELLPVAEEDRSLSFLPWAHSFGQTAELHLMMSRGASLGLAESIPKLIDNLSEVKPTVLFAVPRIFNRIYDGLNKRMAEEKPLKRKLFHKGLEVAAKRRKLAEEGKKSAWLDLQYKFFDKLVFSKVRARFGGRLKYAVSGGAALSREVAEFIDNVGITVFEGYGLTETSPIATTNSPKARKIGTIGKPIPEVSIYIIDEHDKILPDGKDGEIVVIGPNVMQGYHKLDEETAKVIFQLEGKRAFKTGDKGRRDPDGFIRITGRVKEQYKLENGKYVVPSPLEEQLKLSGFISQAYLYGDNKLYNVVLIVPDFDYLEKWAKTEGIQFNTREDLVKAPPVLAKIKQEIDHYSAGEEIFKGYEVPKKFALLTEDFTVENDLMTPKMSIKRNNVLKRYQSLLDSLYK